MTRWLAVGVLSGLFTVAGLAITAEAQAPTRQRLFVTPIEDTDFHVFIAAAMTKKGVPVDITMKPENADLILTASAIEVEKQSTGSKWARCIFASCAGIQDKSNVSVQIADREGLVRWSYAVNKGRGGQKNKQSMAEAIAKHFKDAYGKIRAEDAAKAAKTATAPSLKQAYAMKPKDVTLTGPEAAQLRRGGQLGAAT